MKSEYFIVLGIAFIVPLIKSFSREISFYKYSLRLIYSIGFPFIVFIIWDAFAVSRGHWSFNENYITGIKIFSLPVEEILFFIIIPFCALFAWEVVKYFMRKSS
jgi:lycopene cyclase domain-containing protein